jgi:hypothetical protein
VDCNPLCCNDCSGTGTTTAITSTERYVTGTTVNEEYSMSGLVSDQQWTHVAIRFTAYETIEGCDLVNRGSRKGRLDVIINGYLKWTVHDFDEFLFKELNEHREKQQGVPFNYSFGGGSQGLIETNTVNGPDVRDERLVIEENFAGTFEGCVQVFKLYGCSLDTTIIRQDFNNNKDKFGLTGSTITC